MTQKSLKICGSQVWLGTEQGWAEVDIFCRSGKIEAIGASLSEKADQTIDARGRLLIPGAIDAHVHFRDPGFPEKEDFTSGSIAAAAGGVTTVFDMPNTNPATLSVEALEEKKGLARAKALVNVGFFMGASATNLPEILRAKDICGVKAYLGSSTGSLLLYQQAALEALFDGTPRELVLALHCEDEMRIRARSQTFADRQDPIAHTLIRDHEVALKATVRALDLANRYHHRTHIVHVSTRQECELLAERPPWVSSEVTLHHLFLNQDDYSRFGNRIKVNPAIKNKEDNSALLEALKSGTIDMIASDHAPHTLSEKNQSELNRVPSGLPVVENSLGLMLRCAEQGLCKLEEVIHWCCEAPAQVYNLGHKKGKIALGYDADLVLINPKLGHRIEDERQYTHCKWSPWHGEEFQAWPETTIVLGQVAFDKGKANLECRGTNPFQTDG